MNSTKSEESGSSFLGGGIHGIGGRLTAVQTSEVQEGMARPCTEVRGFGAVKEGTGRAKKRTARFDSCIFVVEVAR